MRLLLFGCLLPLAITGSLPGLAEQPTGPATLENLAQPEETQDAAANADNGSTAGRPAGTLVRPSDGAQHPDLEKAWADYDAAVAKAAAGIRAAISKQFDAATAKADLDEAEKWQNALDKFERTGEVPTDNKAKAAASAAVVDYKKAREELSTAYESVVKSLTMDKKIAEARAARNEWTGLAAGAAVPVKPKKWEQPKNGDAWQKAQGVSLTVDSRHGKRNPLATGITLQRGQMCWVAAHPEDKWNQGRGWPLSDFRGELPLWIELGGTVAKVADGPFRASEPCELRLFSDDVEAADNSGKIRVKVMIVKP